MQVSSVEVPVNNFPPVQTVDCNSATVTYLTGYLSSEPIDVSDHQKPSKPKFRSKNADISPPPLEDMEIETDSLDASKIIATAHNQ